MKLNASALLLVLLPASCAAAKHLKPKCDGFLKSLIIDFETDGHGNPLSASTVPTTLPGGVLVNAKRGKRSPVPASGNDALILNTEAPLTDLDLSSTTEDLVLIINESNDPWFPDDNRHGGTVTFTFTQPIFSVNSLRLLDIEEVKSNRDPYSVSCRRAGCF